MEGVEVIEEWAGLRRISFTLVVVNPIPISKIQLMMGQY